MKVTVNFRKSQSEFCTKIQFAALQQFHTLKKVLTGSSFSSINKNFGYDDPNTEFITVLMSKLRNSNGETQQRAVTL